MAYSESTTLTETAPAAVRLPDDAHRRPIGARDTGWARRLSSFLVERGVSPNWISVGGMAAGVTAGVALYFTHYETDARPWLWLAAPALILLRLLANMFDGMVAVESGRASRVGDFMNDAPDRVSDVAVLVGAGYAAGGSPELGLTAACVALFVAYVRIAGKAAGAPSDFRGPVAKQHRMHTIAAASLAMAAAEFLSLDRLIEWGPGREWDVVAAALALVIAGGVVTATRRWCRVIASLRDADRAGGV